MKFYRLRAFIIVVLVAGAFFALEFKILPHQLAAAIKRYELIHYKESVPTIVNNQATPRPAPLEGAIVFKRSMEEDIKQLIPPETNPLMEPAPLSQGITALPSSREKIFPKAESIEHQVAFWKSIYMRYTSDFVIIHDSVHLDLVYEVLDFSAMREQGYSDDQINELKWEEEEDALAKTDEILEKLSQLEGKVHYLSAEEKKIWRLWSQRSQEEDRFEQAREQLRSQGGLANRFAEAIQNSGSYLVYMEDIFREYDVPVEITRLAFVESLFNLDAYSKVGAAGIWQFMPGTAKRYLKMNEWVDERLDPLIATHAAAKLLRSNYEALESWPLAINAYNAGLGRMKRAVRTLGTDDIAVIITEYNGRGYGFASRNFYPEFLAALEVVDNHRLHFGDLPIRDPLSYEIVQLPDEARFEDVARVLQIDVADLHRLNPAFLPDVIAENLTLPRGTAFRVPLGDGNTVLTEIYNLARD
jgi:membrane-bound lytic murein transglycosylase D